MLNFLNNEERSHDENDKAADKDDHATAVKYDNTVERLDNIKKLSALYKEDWKVKSCEELMDRKYFQEILEFWETPKAMILECETVSNRLL